MLINQVLCDYYWFAAILLQVFIMLEEARKFSRTFHNLAIIKRLLKRDFKVFKESNQLNEEEAYAKYASSVAERFKTELVEINQSVWKSKFVDIEGLKPKVYLLFLLFRYLKRKNQMLTTECKLDLAQLESELQIDVVKEGLPPGSISDEEVLKLVRKSAEEHQFIERVLLKFIRSSKAIIDETYENFIESHAFLLEDITSQAMDMDIETARIGELFRMPEETFNRIISNAENGYKEDQKHTSYTQPQLKMNQVMILFTALQRTGGISKDVKNRPLAYHVGRITNYSENKLAQGMSSFETIVATHSHNRDAHDGKVVIEYLEKVIKWLDLEISNSKL